MSTTTAFDANANVAASPAMATNAYAASPAMAAGNYATTTGPQFVGEVRSAPQTGYVEGSTYTTGVPTTYVEGSTYTTGVPTTAAYTTTNVGAYPADQKPSAIKGNIEAISGKLQHNPEKVYHGNMMLAQTSEQKAARFEAKALEWEQKGNITKAQKNRDKAQRYHLKAANKINAANAAPITAAPKGAIATGTGVGAYPVGTTGVGAYPVGTAYPAGTTYVEGTTYTSGVGAYPVGTTGVGAYPVGSTYGTAGAPIGAYPPTGVGMTTKQMDRVAKFEAKALAAERGGNVARANKNRDKANRVRSKAGVAPIGTYPLSTAVPFANAAPLTSTGVPLTSVHGQVPIATTQPAGYVGSNVGTTTYVQPATVTTTTTTTL